ncbi:MAG: PAS domain S-box protein [Desulfobacterales bacterium]|nr:PAS domain S-box protein [Desulfobacterales bacterium]
MPKLAKLNRLQFILSIAIYVVALIAYGFWIHFHHKEEILGYVDKKLYNTAITIKFILPDDFHDRAIDAQAISINEDKYLANKLTRLVKETGFKYAYTVIKKGDKLFFAACDLIEDSGNERGTFYFYDYEGADEIFLNAFNKEAATYKTVTDQWGTVRTVIVPEKSPSGAKYLACVDYDISYVKGLLNRNLLKSIITALFFLLMAIPIIGVYISSQKKYLENIKDSEAKFRTLAESSPIAIAILRQDNYLYVNSSWESLTGYNKEEAKELKPIMTVHPDMRDQVYKNAEDRLNYKDIQTRYEMKGVTKNGGTIWYDFSATLLNYGDEPAILGFFSDLTDRKKIEQEREEIIKKLKQALDEINTLKGIVPICSSCKKIRDDKGYWNQLESYIESHSDAAFSHGLCPDCSDKLYGEKEWYKKFMKNRTSK